jgi:hypothetical protein
MGFFQFRKRNASLVSLCPQRDSDDRYYLGCGCYVRLNGRWVWTGESILGVIPVAELVRWAVAQGYAQLEMSCKELHEEVMRDLAASKGGVE